MNKKEIKYILNLAGYSGTNKIGPTPLVGITLFNENRFVDPTRVRFEFDFQHDLMKVYMVKKYHGTTVPSSWKEGTYDYYNNEIYRYMCDRNGDPIVDYIDFASIDLIGIDDSEVE